MIKEYWEKSTPMNFKDEKWKYEQKRQFRYKLQDYMYAEFNFDKFPGKKILEIGCGSGIDAIEFASYGAFVTATDMTVNAIDLTKQLAEEAKVKIETKQCLATELPFNNEEFDCVYSYGVLHHIPEVKKTIDEIHRVLKPEGKLMIMLYNRDSLLYAYSIIYLHGIKEDYLLLDDNVERYLTSKYSERNEGCPYTKVYTKEEARKLLEGKFKDINIKIRYNVIDTKEERKVKLNIDEKYELGWHIIVKATKQ